MQKTDDLARKVLTHDTNGSAEISDLKNCITRLNKYTTDRKWEKDYVALKNSISQGEKAVEVIKQTLAEGKSDETAQHVLLNKLRDRIGTDPSNRDLIARIEQMHNAVTSDKDLTGDILVLEKELEKIAQQRQQELQRENEKKQLINYLLVLVLYEQRLGFCALTSPGDWLWNKLAKEWKISATLGEKRINFFRTLGEQPLTPAARQLYNSLDAVMSETSEKIYDFSTKEDRNAVKKDAVMQLKKIAKYEELCRDALHEESEQYRKLMAAQNAILGDEAESIPLGEMQERLQDLQKASPNYMETRVEQSNIVGEPRREARLVYAAALHNFAQKFGRQLGEAMKCRDITAMDWSGDMTKEYIKNSLTALNMMIKAQTGGRFGKRKSGEGGKGAGTGKRDNKGFGELKPFSAL